MAGLILHALASIVRFVERKARFLHVDTLGAGRTWADHISLVKNAAQNFLLVLDILGSSAPHVHEL